MIAALVAAPFVLRHQIGPPHESSPRRPAGRPGCRSGRQQQGVTAAEPQADPRFLARPERIRLPPRRRPVPAGQPRRVRGVVGARGLRVPRRPPVGRPAGRARARSARQSPPTPLGPRPSSGPSRCRSSPTPTSGRSGSSGRGAPDARHPAAAARRGLRRSATRAPTTSSSAAAARSSSTRSRSSRAERRRAVDRLPPVLRALPRRRSRSWRCATCGWRPPAQPPRRDPARPRQPAAARPDAPARSASAPTSTSTPGPSAATPVDRATPPPDARSTSTRKLNGATSSTASRGTSRASTGSRPGTEWADYDDEHELRRPGRDRPKERARRASSSARRRLDVVWDLGANTGRFSRIAAAAGRTGRGAFDIDPAAVERHYRALRKRRPRRTSCRSSWTSPTRARPSAGPHASALSLSERGRSRRRCSRWPSSTTSRSAATSRSELIATLAPARAGLIIELVPADDPMVGQLLATREDVFPDYTPSRVPGRLRAHVRRPSTASPSPAPRRVLYLMRRASAAT